MDFRSAAEEISRVEKGATEYEPPKGKTYRAERIVEFSPSEILDMEYGSAVAQYGRLEKILSASSMDVGLMGTGIKAEEAPPLPAEPSTAESEKVSEEMRKISASSARESEALFLPEVKEAAQKAMPKAAPLASAQAPKPSVEKEEELPLEFGEAPQAQAPAAPKKGIGAAKPAEKKAAPPEEKEEEELFLPPPPPEKMAPAPPELLRPRVPSAPAEREISEEVSPPPMISESPEKSAHETFTRIEQQFQAQVSGTGKAQKKVDVEGAKKRMMELTRELFKERSFDRREEIKKEIVMLKNLVAESREKGAGAASAPAGALFSAVRNDQDYEVSSAKKFLEELFSQRSKELSAAMREQMELKGREQAVEEYSRKMVTLEQKLTEIIDKYSVFLAAKHSFELSELASTGQFVNEAEKEKAEIKENYPHEFSVLKQRIGDEIHSSMGAAKDMLVEPTGDPKERALAHVRGAEDEDLLNFFQAKDPRTYDKYARGELNRAETLVLARRKMAQDLGLDEDTINKYFGVK